MIGHQKRTPENDIHAADRERQVVELRLQGWEFEDIASEVGYADKGGAHKAWKRALARIPAPAAHQARMESQMRLNAVLKAVWTLAVAGDADAIHTLLKIEERRSKLLGLDLQKDAPLTPPIVIREYPKGIAEAV